MKSAFIPIRASVCVVITTDNSTVTDVSYYPELQYMKTDTHVVCLSVCCLGAAKPMALPYLWSHHEDTPDR
jgi:hypothetical protein